MTAADYRAAVARTSHGPEPGRLTDPPWDPELTRAMAEHGTAVVEQRVADVLRHHPSPALLPELSRKLGGTGALVRVGSFSKDTLAVAAAPVLAAVNQDPLGLRTGGSAR